MSLMEMIRGLIQPNDTASDTGSMADMFRPILEAVAQDAKRRADPMSRIGDVGSAIFDSLSNGTPYGQNLAARDTQRTAALSGAGNLFLTLMGQERQIKQAENESAYRTATLAQSEKRIGLEERRLGLSEAAAVRSGEQGTVTKIGEDAQGVPQYGFVTKSGRVVPLATGTQPPAISSAPGDDQKAADVAALLDQSKRGPRYKWQNGREGGEPAATQPPITFTPPEGASPAQAKKDDPPYRIYKGKPVLTPAQISADRQFGKTYEDFVASGGAADAEKNLAQLKSVLGKLQAGESLTGPVFGSIPRALSRLSHPKETQALEQVEEVVQRNLRLILGAQFTQKEGERLVARSYNPALDPKYNAERLGRLIQAMEGALGAKRAAAEYFEQHGTLAGYKGPAVPSATQLEAAIDRPAGGPKLPAGVTVKRSGRSGDRRVHEGSDGKIYDDEGRVAQ